MLAEQIELAAPFDALYLDLHGAMVASHLDDGEGELLARLRERLGAALPIVVTLDFHANISRQMVDASDLMLVYRTYPHVDMADTGQRAAQLMEPLLRGERWHKAYRQADFLVSLPWQCTLIEPCASLMRQSQQQEQVLPNQASGGVVSCAIAPGFPLADIADCGPTVLAYGDATAAEALASQLLHALQVARPAFAGTLYAPEQAVAKAQALLTGGCRSPVILADTQDNPGGGANSDCTDLIHALIAAGVQGACVALLCDPHAARAAHAAGVGASIRLSLGAGSGIGAAPVSGEFTVAALGDGQFTGTGPFYLGCRMNLGLMARLTIGGVDVLISSNKQQAADQEMFRHLGLEPDRQSILVLKSSVHFRADFGPLADHILVVQGSGENVADLASLQYHNLRPGMQRQRD